MVSTDDISIFQKNVFDAITKKNIGELKKYLAQFNGTVDFVDENGMTPLQHACYKGDADFVRILLDQGADVNSSKHASNYTALHFAALSGNIEVCRMLLLAGANTNTLNSVNRTASQMAAFVGNHAAVSCINNFIPLTYLEYYTKAHGQQKEPLLSIVLLEPFHKFVVQSNVHPVRIAINLQKSGVLSDNLEAIRKVLIMMSEKEIQNHYELNEIMALKYHYLSWIIGEIQKCREYFQSRKENQMTDVNAKSDFLELFAKRVLKENKMGQMEYLESTIRDCVRDFPSRDIAIVRQVIVQLANKDSLPALIIIRTAINGQRAFDDTTYCSACGDEKPDKKCSKCKEVKYCDRECQRLHWFMHKKNCARSITTPIASTSQDANKKIIDTVEITEHFQDHSMTKLNEELKGMLRP